jgi:hypothetical protein
VSIIPFLSIFLAYFYAAQRKIATAMVNALHLGIFFVSLHKDS